jgi:hypothetical protein
MRMSKPCPGSGLAIGDMRADAHPAPLKPCPHCGLPIRLTVYGRLYRHHRDVLYTGIDMRPQHTYSPYDLHVIEACERGPKRHSDTSCPYGTRAICINKRRP